MRRIEFAKPRKTVDVGDAVAIRDADPVDAAHRPRCDLVFSAVHRGQTVAGAIAMRATPFPICRTAVSPKACPIASGIDDTDIYADMPVYGPSDKVCELIDPQSS